MNPVYNSHILRWKNVNWQQSQRTLIDTIHGCQGSHVIAKVRQGGKLIEIPNARNALVKQLSEQRVNLATPFDLEVITRHPQANKNVSTGEKADTQAYVDRHDFNCLQWNGERGSASVNSSPMRHAPMFFRSNGMNGDLVDLYSGQTLFLVLNGSSLAGFDWAKLKQPGICTFGVNNGAHGFRPNFWTCVDDPTRFMRSIWADPTITKFIPMAHFEKPIWDKTRDVVSEWRVKDFPSVYGYRRNEAFKADQWLVEDTINWGNHSKLGGGRSVMLAALRIAFLLGFRKVCLVGCDFYMDDNNRYWFAEERTKQAVSNNQNSYRILTDFFEQLQPKFLASGFRVFNCNPKSHLKVFPQADLDEELKAARIDLSETTMGMYVDRYKHLKQQAKKPAPVRKSPPKQPTTKAEMQPAPAAKPSSQKIVNNVSAGTRRPVPGKPVEVELLQQVVGSLRSACRHEEPFTHLELRSAFPVSLYQSMLQNLPDDHHYHEVRPASVQESGSTASHLRFAFTPREIGMLTGSKQIFWSQVKSALQDRRLEAAVRTALQEALHKRFGQSLAKLILHPSLELLREVQTGETVWRPEIVKKAVTVQFFLPEDASHQEWGTAYYRKNGGGKFTAAKKLNYLPMTGHAFVLNEHSYHGIEASIPAGQKRNSLILTYHVRERQA